MKIADIPAKFVIPFADQAGAGYIRAVPLAPTGTPGNASLELGFPPENFSPVSAGGVPPFGQDFNGILEQISAWSRWAAAGGMPIYDGAFATNSDVAGYPRGTVLSSTTAGNLWLCTIDDNTSDPDAGGAGWVQIITSATIGSVINFYVNAATGNDNNSGLNSGSPFQTITGAISAITSRYGVLAGANMNIANGTYDGFSIAGPNVSLWSFLGNNASPSSVVINSPTTGTNLGRAVRVSSNANVHLEGFKFQSYNENVAATSASVSIGGSCVFTGPASAGTIALSSSSGGALFIAGTHTYSGSFGSVVGCAYNGSVTLASNDPAAPQPLTMTAVSTPSFSVGFASVSLCSTLLAVAGSITFSGATTGSRYNVYGNGVINSNGGGAAFLPGSSAGTTGSGGQYL